ncbi:uncharacterized protein K452DRAFT_54027 [Aplosporella prunicola CBS 121167]|uniref:Protein S-acyltransferase n=1 Tax=Aplosporella prunicola CBS 121167 TaxID=1176127 RepID=A0A6A6B9R2_9PEZI|nr:uncharacterized protein K452DRAFT_54027 [Aplosporella prunicola CBS 121167]KAF2140308.1 hypothetical protein K452DRAFT_54027 [Aplosporella prunicola CBS 121167]
MNKPHLPSIDWWYLLWTSLHVIVHYFLPIAFYVCFLIMGTLMVNAYQRNEPISKSMAHAVIAVLVLVGSFTLCGHVVLQCRNLTTRRKKENLTAEANRMYAEARGDTA